MEMRCRSTRVPERFLGARSSMEGLIWQPVKRNHKFVFLFILLVRLQVDGFTNGIGSSRWRGETRTCSRSQTKLSSSRRSRDDRYYDDDNNNDDELYSTQFRSRSKEEIELGKMKYDDYDVNKIDRYRPDARNDELNEEEEWEEEEEEEEGTAGNYWSNPKKGMDPVVPSRRSPRPRRPMPESTAAPHERRYRPRADEPGVRRTRRRTSFRSGTPPPPAVAKDFYNKLFWYGFDPNQTEDVGDKTVFGGTKGKFNGLAYLYGGSERKPSETNRPQRALPPPGNREYDDYYDIEEEEEYYDDEVTSKDVDYDDAVERPRFIKPPTDVPYPRGDPLDPTRRQRRPRANRRGELYDDEDEEEEIYNAPRRGRNWASSQVSSWFSPDEGADEETVDSRGSGARGRRRNRQGAEWSPFNVLDSFFGLNRNERKYQAERYNQQLGIGPARSQRRRRPPGKETPRRPGYAYRYEGDDDEPPVVDIDVTGDSVEPEPVKRVAKRLPVEEEPKQRRQPSWEERALSAERVPPAAIPAWGPSGELDMDARSRATLDAIEDIQTARQKLEVKKKKEAIAREDITILKVDAELQRRRLTESRQGARLAQEQLRQIELDVEDASRALRRASQQVQLSQERLEELEDRHWALLSLYNPDQAGERVAEALKEFQELEPAARLNDLVEPSSAIPMEKVEVKNVEIIVENRKVGDDDLIS